MRVKLRYDTPVVRVSVARALGGHTPKSCESHADCTVGRWPPWWQLDGGEARQNPTWLSSLTFPRPFFLGVNF
jgi:hypothetical protein